MMFVNVFIDSYIHGIRRRCYPNDLFNLLMSADFSTYAIKQSWSYKGKLAESDSDCI